MQSLARATLHSCPSTTTDDWANYNNRSEERVWPNR